MSDNKKVKKGIAGKIITGIFAAVVLVSVAIYAADYIIYQGLYKQITNYPAASESGIPAPEKDKNGEWTFTSDRELKILYLSNIHLGCGAFSVKEDRKTLDRIADAVYSQKPDIIVLSGDTGYQSSFRSGNPNNKSGIKTVINLLEHLGVYWAPAIGEYDSKPYSFYNADYISSLFSDEEMKYCLYTEGPKSVDGHGNYFIHIKDSSGKLVKELAFLDTHAYTDDNLFETENAQTGLHSNQIRYYKERIDEVRKENPQAGVLVFLDLPPYEMREAYTAYLENGNKDTADVRYINGEINEEEPFVNCSETKDVFFQVASEAGGLQGIFFAHDNNSLSLNYKGIDLNYNLSVGDFPEIENRSQLGYSVIILKSDGSYEMQKINTEK